MQRGCIITQRKSVCLRWRLFWGFVVWLRKSARSAGDFLGFHLCGLIEYSCVNILPHIAQITQRNAAGLHYHAEKDRLFEVVRVMWFWVFGFCLRLSAWSAGDLLGFLLCMLIEYSHVNILPQITQMTQRGMQLAALVRSKTIYPNPLLQDEENLNNDQSRSLFHGLE